MPAPQPIAIVGMAGLFPGAPDLATYWRNILIARDAITDLPEGHSWAAEDYLDPDPKAPDKTWCTRGGFIEPVPFDPVAFGIPPNALDATDSTQLLSLIVAREALRDAGVDPDGEHWDRDRVACVMGVTGTQELAITLGARLQGPTWRRALLRHGVTPDAADAIVADIGRHFPEWQEQSFPGLLGNVVAGRITNRLGLGGTNCVVDAACASSLAAIQLAVADLQAGRSDLALSGGADTLNDIFMYMCFSKTPALSASGDARPFDDTADGILISEGIGMVALKRLADAERDGDRVYAVLKGIGSSSDGRSRSIYAPNPDGQAKAIRRAYTEAGFPLDTIGLVEAHGTGTRAGDAAEVAGLNQVFGELEHETIALGSVKSQIGHTKSAAGVAGLMKAALALHHQVLPPTAKVKTPNRKIDLSTSALYPNVLARPWVHGSATPRRAGVSAFGFGGSNFHVALEEHPASAPADALAPPDEALFVLTAASPDQLVAALDALRPASAASVHHLSREVLAAYAPGAHVVAWTAADLTALAARIQTARALVGRGPGSDGDVHYGVPDDASRKVAVLFPGQGSQYVNMGRTLALRHRPMRAALDRADAAMRAAGRGSLAARIYPAPAWDDAGREAQVATLTATEWAQPALGAVSAGMYALLRAHGVTPAALAGHSYGELVALHASGALSEADLWTLSRVRGEAMADRGADRGTMAAVSAPLADVEAVLPELGPDVVLANRNHPRQGVISGSKAAIAAAVETLAAKGISAIPLSVSAAFHSPLVADAAGPLREALANVVLGAPDAPVYANVTAAPYPSDPAAARELLATQITSAVDFVGIVEAMVADGVRTFIECGPKGVVRGLLRRCLKRVKGAAWHALDGELDQLDGDVQLKRTLAWLAARGVDLDVTPLLAEALPPDPRQAGSSATIWLGGANYRKPETRNPPPPARPALATRAPVAAPAAKPDVRAAAPPPGPARAAAPAPIPTPPPRSAPMASDPQRPTPPAEVGGALQTTRDSLVAFQRAQERIAEVHTEFLRAHARANESFATLFDTHARLVAQWSGDALPAPPPAPRAPAHRQATAPAPVAPPPVAPPMAAPAAALASSFLGHDGVGRVQPVSAARPAIADEDDLPPMVTADGAVAAPAHSAPTPASTAPAVDLQAVLMATVAAKTGYPADALHLPMDLEADLGIDSIKRVEILAAVQEEVPGLPDLDNDALAALRTLGDVLDHLRAIAPATVGAAAPAAPAVDLQAVLMATVAAKTGYPADALHLPMDLEADLGIDSIKRVEILAAVQEEVPGLPDLDNDALAALRTLGDVLDHLRAVSPGAPTAAPAPVAPTAAAAAPSAGTLPMRRVVRAVPAPTPLPAELPAPLVLTRDPNGLADAVASALAARGCAATVVDPDWRDDAAIAAAIPAGAASVVHLAAAGAVAEDLAARVRGAFLVARAAPNLAVFATVSRLGGRFGQDRAATGESLEGALAGLPKTLAAERPAVRCLALDVRPDTTAERIAAELCADRGCVEVGLVEDGALTLASDRVPLPSNAVSAPVAEGGLVVISGGARGVTAAVATELARRYRPALLLLGRSPVAGDPDWALGVADDALKPACIAARRAAGAPIVPKEVDADVRGVLAAREVRATLDDLRAAGSAVEYAAVDVRDHAAVAAAVASAVANHGPVQGVIHGAGVLADKLVQDKTPEQFDRVWSTKVDGLEALLAAAGDPAALRLVAAFSSVAGRYGNRGQCDYAMANEALTHRLLALPAGPRVRSFDWGPWDGGMVTPALRRHFAAQGIELIGLRDGAAAFCEDVSRTLPDVEIVIGGPLVTVSRRYADQGHVTHHLDDSAVPFLADHRIDGKPVLPAVIVLEWMARAAADASPGLRVVGVRELAVLKGVVVEGPTHLDLTWRTVASSHAPRSLLCELSSDDGAARRVHYRATVDLAAEPDSPTQFPGSNGLSATPYPHPVGEAYASFLFHGPSLQGITEIVGTSDHGIVARIAASRPTDLGVDGAAWHTDPVVLDSALQLMVLWVRHTLGASALPSALGAYRQHAPLQGELTCHMELTPTNGRSGRFQASLVDDGGQVVATLTDGEYTANPALNPVFRSAPTA